MKVSPVTFIALPLSVVLWLGLIFGSSLLFDDHLLHLLSSNLANARSTSVKDPAYLSDRALVLGFRSETASLLASAGYPNFLGKVEAAKAIVSALATMELSQGTEWYYELQRVQSAALSSEWGKGKARGLLLQLETALENSQAAVQAVAKADNDVREANASLKRVEERFALISSDFIQILGLESTELEDPKSTPPAAFAVYSHGILAGYPIVRGLPDNLATSADLSKELERLGGKTGFANEIEFQTYRERLAQAGIASLGALKDREQLLQNRRNLLINLKERQGELALSKRVIKGILTQILSLASQPTFDHDSISGAIKKVLAYWDRKY